MSDAHSGRFLMNDASRTPNRGLLMRTLAAWPLLASFPDVGAGSV